MESYERESKVNNFKNTFLAAPPTVDLKALLNICTNGSARSTSSLWKKQFKIWIVNSKQVGCLILNIFIYNTNITKSLLSYECGCIL